MAPENDVTERRRYIRHPSDIPLEVISEGHPGVEDSLNNVSFGGLCFKSASAVPEGTVIRVRIALVRPPFEAKCRVAWCREAHGHFNVGVEFAEVSDAFRARMVEQICHIERYKKEVLEKTGRQISGREAAMEWISQYADKF